MSVRSAAGSTGPTAIPYLLWNWIIALQHFGIGGPQKGGWFCARDRVITSDMQQVILKSVDEALSAYPTLVIGLLAAITMNAVFVLTHIAQ